MPFLNRTRLSLAIMLLACPALAMAQAVATRPAGSQLGKEDLFNILAAEFSIQRNELGHALAYYLQQAKTLRNPYLAERATQLAMQQQQYVDMLEAALIWQKMAPANESSHFYTSLAYAFNMQPNIALEHMRKVLHLQAETDFTRLVQLIPQGSPAEDFYIHELQQADRLYPDSYDVPLALALLYMRHNQETLALAHTDKAVANAGSNAAVIEYAVRLYSNYGKTDKALAAYRQAVEANPGNLALRQNFAQFAIQADLEVAREQFEYLREHQPHADHALLNLGLIALEQNRLQAAEQYFLELRQTGQRHSVASYYLGETYRLQKRHDEALAAYAAVNERPDTEHALEKSIAIHIDRKNYAQAEQLIQSAMADTSSSPAHIEQLQLLSAFCLEKQGRLREAYQMLTQLLDKNPDSFELRYSRAMMAEARNELDQMESDLRHIIKLYPDNAVALNALGYTLADKTTRYREALALIEQALKLVPDDPAILDSLGWVLFRMGRFTEAVDYLRHSLSLLPDAEVAAHLGEALWMSGRKDDARQVLKKALDKNPEHPVLHETIQRLNLSF